VATNLAGKSLPANQQLIYLTNQSTLKAVRFDGKSPVEFVLPESIRASIRYIGWRPNKKSLYLVGENQLWNLTARPESKLAEIWRFAGPTHDATIHPVEDRIAWIHTPPNKSAELTLNRTDGSDLRNLGFGFDPYWTADGKSLVYTCRDSQDWHLKVLTGDDTRALRVPFHPQAYLYPCPSPDGKQVAFAMKGADGTMQIGVVRMDGSNVRQLTRQGDGNTFPQFSPDGRFVAFTRSLQAPCCLVIVDSVTNEEFVIANDAKHARPVWHPVDQ
jgi:hypothetical protein